MGVGYNPKIVIKNLVFCMDAGNFKSYPGSGTTANSLIGAASTGTFTSVTYGSTNGGVFNFGTNAYIDCGNDPSVQITDQITLSAWVNPSSLSTARNIINKNNNSGWRYRIETNGALWFYVNGNLVTSASGLITVGNWYHLCVKGNSSGLYGYINGILVMSNTTAFVPADAASNNLLLGAFGGGLETFAGNATLFKIYNRFLSDNEIQQNFGAHRGRFGL